MRLRLGGVWFRVAGSGSGFRVQASRCRVCGSRV